MKLNVPMKLNYDSSSINYDVDHCTVSVIWRRRRKGGGSDKGKTGGKDVV